jgi:hypothetical protein
MWSSGDPALLRYVHGGRVSRVLPTTVVADDDRSTQLYVGPGTTMRTRCDQRGVPIPRGLSYTERFSRRWTLGDGSWTGYHMLMLVPGGAPYAFWAVWDERWEFEEWYVNLQEPLRRTRFGFDTADNVLDVVIARGGTWRWKDEHEVEEAVALGRFTAAEVDELYAAGRRAIETFELGEWPFDRDWSGWRPDPTWPQPRLDPAADHL